MKQISKTRSDWIDATKGLAIILVVMWHVELWHYETTGVWPPFIFPVADVLKELRMPLFFFISGLLIKGLLSRPFSDARLRAINLLFVYIFWGALVSLKQLLISGDGIYDFVARILVLFISPSSFWYFWALAVFTLVARIAMFGKKNSMIALLALSIVISLFGDYAAQSMDFVVARAGVSSHFREFFRNAVFFNMGAFGSYYFSDHIRDMQNRLGVSASVIATLAAVMIYFADLQMPLFRVITGGLLVFATINAAPRLFNGKRIGHIFSIFGRQTGYIYIFHPLYFTLASAAFPKIGIQLPAAPGWIDISIIMNILIALCGALAFSKILKWLRLESLIAGPFNPRQQN